MQFLVEETDIRPEEGMHTKNIIEVIFVMLFVFMPCTALVHMFSG